MALPSMLMYKKLTAGHRLPGVPHDELLVVADAAEHVLVLAVPRHILHLHTSERSVLTWLLTRAH